jgi:hypothetical protein
MNIAVWSNSTCYISLANKTLSYGNEELASEHEKALAALQAQKAKPTAPNL